MLLCGLVEGGRKEHGKLKISFKCSILIGLKASLFVTGEHMLDDFAPKKLATVSLKVLVQI